MPYPREYQRASDDFAAFLDDLALADMNVGDDPGARNEHLCHAGGRREKQDRQHAQADEDHRRPRIEITFACRHDRVREFSHRSRPPS